MRRARAAVHYVRFPAIMAANPLTIVSLTTVATGLSLRGPASAIAFVAGIGLASMAWHVVPRLPLAVRRGG